MSSEKPESVDARAWWSASDDEWVWGEKDDDGRFHGRVTYWRPDGTVVNHCHFVHGTPHGAYARYHESGEVSRAGTFVNGQLQGTDVFTRSAAPTTENFPAGLGEGVWRAEMDMVAGRMVGGRLFDRDGRQVGEDGTPCPDRPEGVPDDAVYSSTTGRWVHGASDDAFLRTGPWRFYATEDGVGWVQQVVTYAAGDPVEEVVYPNRFVSRAEQALAEEDFAACDSAVSDGLEAMSDDVDQLELLEIRVRSLAAQGRASQAVKAALSALKTHPVGSGWGAFTQHGRRGFTATAALEAFVAKDHLAHERGDAALQMAQQAIGHHPQAGAALILLRAKAHAQLGDEDAHFSSVKKALALDDSLPELAPYLEDARFAEWRASIAVDSMTTEGAVAILGERGERLEQFIGVIVEDDDGDAEDDSPRVAYSPGSEEDLDVPLDLDVLPTRSPELVRFAELAPSIDRCRYRGRHVPVCASGLDAAVATMDGTWLARIQTVFLPGSVVSLDDESLVVAAWMPDSRGCSATYGIHQDDAEFYVRSASIAAFVVDQLELDDDDQTFAVPARTRTRWAAAAARLGAPEPLDAHLDLLALELRTHWIVNLLVGKHPDLLSEIHLGKDLATAASQADWERERTLLDWPHLQAYWLMHHAVFGDLEALAEVLAVADRRDPGVADLAGVAAQLLANEPVTAGFWNGDRVNEVRLNALERRPELLSEAAKARVASDNRAAFEASDRLEAALQTLEEEEENARLVGFMRWLMGAAGELGPYQEGMARHEERGVDFIMAMKNGRVTMWEQIYRNMEALPERIAERPSRAEPMQAFFEAAVARGATSPDDHPNTLPGGLYGLGRATVRDAAGFDAFWARVQDMAFYPDKFGPYRRLQMTLLAELYLEESQTAKDFIRAEAARYAAQTNGWSSDTFDTADRILTEAGDEEQLNALNARLQTARFSGANWKASIALARRFLAAPTPLLAPGLKHAVEAGLGRHDDGDRAIVVRAYARCAGSEARASIEDWLASIEDVRKDCERAALLAGLIELHAANDAAETDALASTLEQARAVLPKLRSGSMEVGAALSLLETIHAHELPGFASEAEAMAEAARTEEYGSEELKAWIVEKAGEFRA